MSPNTMRHPQSGSLTLESKICSWSLRCWIPTSEPPSFPLQDLQESTLSHSVHLTGTVSSNSSSTTNAKGKDGPPHPSIFTEPNVDSWTQLQSSTTVPVVPPRHDGYPRFLSAAWPYYAGAISTSIGFVLFSALWLAGDDKVKKSKTE